MNGLPPADRRVERVARIVATVAVVWFALAVCWQIAGPFGAGHVAATAARGIMADNMLRWGILAPVRQYTFGPPPSSLYYAHHPWEIFWINTVLAEIFGRYHDFVYRLAPVIESIATVWLCYLTGRALWGPVAGALAALAYSVLPITLSFSIFNGFEVPLTFGMMLTAWGYARFAQTWQPRWMVVSLFGLLFTVNTDWEALVFAGVVLGVLLITGLMTPLGWFGRVDTRRFGQWWALGASISVGTVIFYLALFHRYHALADLFEQGQRRSSGNSVSLSIVLEARAYWIALMFTPLAILVGKIGAVVMAIRLVVKRNMAEIFPLAILVAATFEYVFFKEGADVHIYWPLPFSPIFALGLGVIGASVESGARWLVTRISKRTPARWPAFVALGTFALVPLAMARDAVTIFAYGRDTGDRFDEGGRVVYQDLDKHAALAWIRDRLAPETRVLLDYDMAYDWSQEWTLRRPIRMVTRAPAAPGRTPDRYYIADARMLAGREQQSLAKTFHVQAVGPIWFVDTIEPQAPLDAYALDAKKPSLWSWYLRYGNDPDYQVVQSPLRTWELRYHLDQSPAFPTGGKTDALDDLRILHNVAVAKDDAAQAAAREKELVGRLDRGPARTFNDGTRLLGVLRDKTARRLWILFSAGRAEHPGLVFGVLSYVDKPMRWSLVPADDKPRVVGARFEIDPSLWKKDFIYAAEMEVRPRPGTESFYGLFRGGAAPRPVSGSPKILLLTTH